MFNIGTPSHIGSILLTVIDKLDALDVQKQHRQLLLNFTTLFFALYSFSLIFFYLHRSFLLLIFIVRDIDFLKNEVQTKIVRKYYFNRSRIK